VPEQLLEAWTTDANAVVDELESQRSTKYSVALLEVSQTKVGRLVAIVLHGDIKRGAGGAPCNVNVRLVLHGPQPDELPASTHQVYVSEAMSNEGVKEQLAPVQLALVRP